MSKEKQNILVLAPHPDDGELGAGGFISKLASSGNLITYVAFSPCEESLPDGFPKDTLIKELKSATSILGVKESNLISFSFKVREFSYSRQRILDEMIKLRSNMRYDIVIAPALNDVHQDHSTVASEAVRAFRNSSTILSYDLPWNNFAFDSKCFVQLSEQNVEKKYKALRCYKSQNTRTYMQKENIFSQVKHKGMQIGCEFAESFEVVRWHLN